MTTAFPSLLEAAARSEVFIAGLGSRYRPTKLRALGSKCSACRLDRCLLAGVNFKAVRLPPRHDFSGFLAQLDIRKRQLAAAAGRQTNPTDHLVWSFIRNNLA